MDVQPSWLAPPRVYVSSCFIVLMLFKPGYASLELIALAKKRRDK